MMELIKEILTVFLLPIATWVVFSIALYYTLVLGIKRVGAIGKAIMENSFTIEYSNTRIPAFAWALFGYLLTF